MNLFFETAGQAGCFLIMLPIGFAAAACLDAGAAAGRLRPALDVLVLLLAGVALLLAVVLLRENAVRAYHLLGLLTGAVLYVCGVGRAIRLMGARRRRKKT